MTLVPRPLRPRAIEASQMLHFIGNCGLDNGLLHDVTNLVWTLVHDFGTRTFVLGVEFQFLAGGGKPTRTRGSKCEKRRPCSRAPRAGAVCIFGVPHGSATGER
jgi:hypothetical protein